MKCVPLMLLWMSMLAEPSIYAWMKPTCFDGNVFAQHRTDRNATDSFAHAIITSKLEAFISLLYLASVPLVFVGYARLSSYHFQETAREAV